jgi:hypothetical protein
MKITFTDFDKFVEACTAIAMQGAGFDAYWDSGVKQGTIEYTGAF